jgi:hypothetical protein
MKVRADRNYEYLATAFAAHQLPSGMSGCGSFPPAQEAGAAHLQESLAGRAAWPMLVKTERPQTILPARTWKLKS